MSKYSINPQPIEILLSWIKSVDIAIPEIQRPFAWKGSKVRDLIDLNSHSFFGTGSCISTISYFGRGLPFINSHPK